MVVQNQVPLLGASTVTIFAEVNHSSLQVGTLTL